MNIRKITALFAAAAVMMTAGCSDGGDSSESAQTAEAATSQAADADTSAQDSTASVLTADIAEDTVIASTADGDMTVTFGQFLKEYKYYMQTYGYTDDTSEDYAETLAQQRERIVNYLINEQIFFTKFDELGMSFTDDELAQIQSDTDSFIESMKQSCRDSIESSSIEQYTDEELDEMAETAISELLDSCGMTEDDFYGWAYSSAVQTKLEEYVNEDFTLDYSEAEEQAQNVIDGAKASYESDPASYDGNSFSSLYIPDGSRYVEQIVLKLPDVDITEINELRDGGDDEGADALRAEKLTSLDEELAEVQEKLDGGADFEELMTEYSDDSDTSAKYLITPDTEIYVDGLVEAAMAMENVGDVILFESDYGYHLVKYLGEAEVDTEESEAMIQAIYDYLLVNEQALNFNTAVREWREEYEFNIERELLLLLEEDTDEATQAEATAEMTSKTTAQATTTAVTTLTTTSMTATTEPVEETEEFVIDERSVFYNYDPLSDYLLAAEIANGTAESKYTQLTAEWFDKVDALEEHLIAYYYEYNVVMDSDGAKAYNAMAETCALLLGVNEAISYRSSIFILQAFYELSIKIYHNVEIEIYDCVDIVSSQNSSEEERLAAYEIMINDVDYFKDMLEIMAGF